MSAITGILAGVVTAAGAVAFYRVAKQRVRTLRNAIVRAQGGETPKRAPIIEFERDPDTGVYRSR